MKKMLGKRAKKKPLQGTYPVGYLNEVVMTHSIIDLDSNEFEEDQQQLSSVPKLEKRRPFEIVVSNGMIFLIVFDDFLMKLILLIQCCNCFLFYRGCASIMAFYCFSSPLFHTDATEILRSSPHKKKNRIPMEGLKFYHDIKLQALLCLRYLRIQTNSMFLRPLGCTGNLPSSE